MRNLLLAGAAAVAARKFGLIALVALAATSVQAADAVGRIISVEGKPKIERASGGMIDLKRDDPVHVGDILHTGAGRAKILFQDNSIMTLGEQTDLKISEFLFQQQPAQRSSMFDLLSGKVKTLVGKLMSSAPTFNVRTPTAVAGVRGTFFQIDFDGETQVTVFDGEVEIKNGANELLNLTGGQALKMSGAGFGGGALTLTDEEMAAKDNELAMRDESGLNSNANKKVDRGGFARRAVDSVGPLPSAGGEFQSIDSNSDNVPNTSQDLQSVDPALSGNVKLQLQFPAERR